MIEFLKTIRLIPVSFVLWGMSLSNPTKAFNFNNVVVIGDSLSDTGNVFTFFGGAFVEPPFGGLIPQMSYASGRFADDLIYVDFLAEELGFNADPSLLGGPNFAVGGAQTGPLKAGLPPSLLDQTAAFLMSTGGIAPSDTLYLINGSTNDLRPAAVLQQQGDNAAASAIALDAATNVASIIASLANAGAEDFFVFNSADLGITPEATRGPAGLDLASTSLSLQFNALLEGALSPFEDNLGGNLTLFDFFGLSREVVENPANFGLTEVVAPCITETTLCTNPNDFLFYDGIHPTSAAHQIIASAVLETLRPIPEPSMIIGIGLVFGWGIYSRKRKN